MFSFIYLNLNLPVARYSKIGDVKDKFWKISDDWIAHLIKNS
jgi:hypothetical protein